MTFIVTRIILSDAVDGVIDEFTHSARTVKTKIPRCFGIVRNILFVRERTVIWRRSTN